ncbi:hypothetical protein C8Q80DRAFT_1273018 [Daedaleopsis nitida]|nr:hypothetical protein C8Q80DRAFT_1273018 [Daedaleopsis nitida]
MAQTASDHWFFNASFITIREGVDALGDHDVIGADVTVTIASVVNGAVIIIVDQATLSVWFADFIRPEWAYMRVGRCFRWEIPVGADMRQYCLTFDASTEVVRFAESFLSGRRAALGWPLPAPGAIPLDLIALSIPQVNEQPAGGDLTLVEVDDGYWNLVVAFLKMFFGLAMIRVVMVLSDRVVDSFFQYW